MQFTPLPMPNTVLFSENIPEDDIDRLFQHLGKLEPPADSVRQILARIRQLPATLHSLPTSPQDQSEPPKNPRETSGASQ